MAGDIFGNRETSELTCLACGRVVHVVNPKLATFHQEPTNKKLAPVAPEVGTDGRLLRLPESQEITLRTLKGEEAGTVYPITKPRTTIGRTSADITIDDRLVSRLHCAMEISDEGVLIRDLESTNGTLVGNKPVKTASLVNGSTFRVGDHVFQVVITPKEP